MTKVYAQMATAEESYLGIKIPCRSSPRETRGHAAIIAILTRVYSNKKTVTESSMIQLEKKERRKVL